MNKSTAALGLSLLLVTGTAFAQEAPPPTPDEEAPAAAPVAQVSAATSGPLIQLGLGVGLFIPTSDLGAHAVIGIDTAVQLPVADRRLGVGLGLSYAQPTTSGTVADTRVPDGEASYETTMRELMLDVRLAYRFFRWSERWSPHVALGPVIYFLSHATESLDHKQTETSTQVGVVATLGADFKLGPGALIGEVRIPFAPVSQKTTGDANVGAVSISVGYRFHF